MSDHDGWASIAKVTDMDTTFSLNFLYDQMANSGTVKIIHKLEQDII